MPAPVRLMLLRVDRVVRDYRLPRPHLLAPARHRRVLHGVSLDVETGGALGLVGESGSGKSTLARCVLGLDRPLGGRVLLNGEDVHASRPRGAIQGVFQDPYGSLDPRMTVGQIVAEPLLPLHPRIPRRERETRVSETLEAVGLSAASGPRYPHQFSGGQRQRIALARAIVTRPALIVADEPVSALDVSVQAQVLALIRELRSRYGVAWLFVSHDLAVVRIVTDRTAVLYAGRIVELGESAAILDRPLHPYTRALVSAVPGRGAAAPWDMAGDVEAADTGCAYAPRCPLVHARCHVEAPRLRKLGAREVACHAPLA